MCFKLLLKAGRHANAGRLPEGVPWIHLFLVNQLKTQFFSNVLFECFFLVFRRKFIEKRLKRKKKGWTWLKKCFNQLSSDRKVDQLISMISITIIFHKVHHYNWLNLFVVGDNGSGWGRISSVSSTRSESSLYILRSTTW